MLGCKVYRAMILMCHVGTRPSTASIHHFLEAQPAATKKRKADSEREEPRRRPAREPTDDYRGTSWNPATMYPFPMAYSNPMAYYPYRDLRGSNVRPWFNDGFGTFFRPETTMPLTYNTAIPTTAADLSATSILACKFRVLDIFRRVLQLTLSQRLLRLLRLLPLRYLRLLLPLLQRLLQVSFEP
jgi:hypothetical protein